jgi:acetolactate synthase-1/3 small subunit
MNAINRNELQAISRAVLEIDVNNHPGVMSHVVGLFSRRAFNVEGILCMPVGDGSKSRIWLLVNEDQRLPQMVRQLEKLEDVLAVRRHGADHAVFERLEDFFQA